eukprot:7785557-Karenia_brevis.AAC.1
MEGSGEMPEVPLSPINSPRGPDGPVSADQSFLVLPGGESSGGGDVVAPQGPQYPVNMVAEPDPSRMRSDEEIAKI